MKTTFKLTLLAAGSALSLAACDGGSSVVTPTPPAGTTSLADMFGAAFGVIFRASANTDPVEPSASSVIPISLTADPIPVP